MTQSRKTLLLIDTSALIYRSYHALPPLTKRDGTVVNAVYGVATTILAVIKELKPTQVIAAFDVKEPTFRHKLSSDYKATRKKTPDELVAQLPLVRELIDAMGIDTVEQAGYEADDIIGTLAHYADTNCADTDIVIVTGDNDALQLVTESIRVRTFGRGIKDVKVYDIQAVQTKYGLTPAQLIDYKGLAGDSSDNIPGVTGVGAVTATKLLQKYDNLENVYAHIDDIKGAVQTKLIRDRAQAFLSKELGTICTTMDLALCTPSLCAGNSIFGIDIDATRTFFGTMNFTSLIVRISGDKPNSSQENKTNKKSAQKYITLTTANETAEFLDKLTKVTTSISFAIATSGDGALIGLAFTTADILPTFIMLTPETTDELSSFFGNTQSKINLVTHDAKSAIRALATANISCAITLNDTELASYLINPSSKHTLAYCVLDAFGEILPDVAPTQLSLIGSGDDTDAIAKHAIICVGYISKLNTHYVAKIAQISKEQLTNLTKNEKLVELNITNIAGAAPWTLATVLSQMETPSVPILAAMEAWGITFDTSVVEEASAQITTKLTELSATIFHHAGTEFNINSPKQLAAILFETLKLPTTGIKKTKTGYSTATAELAKLRSTHDIIAQIESYRELFKLKSTYIDVLPTLVADDGRIHSTFHQTVTATGRLSSSDPNLQNIPTRGEYATIIRRAFRARTGYQLISADYSQIDLRCIAHIAQDTAMIDAFNNGEDIHRTTAAAINDVTIDDVTPDMRRAAKALNFGLIYGMGAFGFAASAGVPVSDAQKFIDAYFTKFTGVAAYMERTRAEAKKHGYVQTPLGRRRAVPEINANNAQVAKSGERMAINMPIQGCAADIMKLAILVVSNKYNLTKIPFDTTTNNAPVRMVLQVHDEIILEVKDGLVDDVRTEITKLMENVVTLRVPLVVNTTVGTTWAELK